MLDNNFLLCKINLFKMVPAYFSELTFDDKKKIFVLKFSSNDEIKKKLFLTKKGYFITSFRCFIKLVDDITDWIEKTTKNRRSIENM